MQKQGRIILFIASLLIAILLLVVSSFGLNADLYNWEAPEWRLQCAGQDLVDLVFVFPTLLISSLLLFKNKLLGKLVWPGVILYLIYTFVIYCFDVHFNSFFIEYCVILGLSVYSLGYFIYSNTRQETQVKVFPSPKLIKIIAVYFIFLSVAFYLLWLSDIIKAIRAGDIPDNLYKMQLPTNPVHVLDIALLLPLFFITGLLLLRRKTFAFYLAAYLLVFSSLMNLTILVLDVLLENSLPMQITFGSLTLLSGILFIAVFRFHKTYRARIR